MRLFLVVICVMLTTVCFAQTTEGENNGEGKPQQSATSLEPYYPKEEKKPKKVAKKTNKGPSYETEKDYYNRMARLVKAKRKAEKEMEKPQYSNPMYFGHKKPPKKNKAGKLKYCKECGIRH